MQVQRQAASVPGRALGAMLDLLKRSLPPTSHQFLAEFHSEVVEALKTTGPDTGTAAGDDALIEKLPVLKALVARGGKESVEHESLSTMQK